ncbi:hypothetical protein GGF46_001526 [Coemansia sp. RSA 552]|nr:hypothetical protein GGF46_001526 [Coemansia sp. RSA 552]
MADSIITSVTQQTAFARPHGDSSSEFLPAQLSLNVRGRHFTLDRETLNHLPDSLVNTMFPNGLMHLGRGYGDYGDYPYYRGAGAGGEAEQTWVDFDPNMLEYVFQAYGKTLDYDLLASCTPTRQGDGAQATGAAPGESDDDQNNNNGSNDGNGDNAEPQSRQEGSDASADEPASADAAGAAWPNYTNDGKANIASSSATAQPGSEPRPQAGGAGPKGDESMSTVNNNSSSGIATQSTTSSAVLNYMRFVSGTQAAAATGGRGDVEPPMSSGAMYYDRFPLVVLREELDYFVVPTSGRTRGDISDTPGFSLDMAKTRSGELLREDDSVFEPLERTMQRNLEKWRSKLNAEGASEEAQALHSASIIEQQLIDMLCLAGFPRNARWGCRRVEPSKTSVTSLLTVPLDESTDQSHTVAAQKLLLFYKKPARKCWWEGEDINAGDSKRAINLKLWCRRTWTLELVLI